MVSGVGNLVILSDGSVNAAGLICSGQGFVSSLEYAVQSLEAHLIRGSLATGPDERFVRRRATTATFVRSRRSGNSSVRCSSSRTTSIRSTLCSRLRESNIRVARIGTRRRRGGWRGRELVSRRPL